MCSVQLRVDGATRTRNEPKLFRTWEPLRLQEHHWSYRAGGRQWGLRVSAGRGQGWHLGGSGALKGGGGSIFLDFPIFHPCGRTSPGLGGSSGLGGPGKGRPQGQNRTDGRDPDRKSKSCELREGGEKYDKLPPRKKEKTSECGRSDGNASRQIAAVFPRARSNNVTEKTI